MSPSRRAPSATRATATSERCSVWELSAGVDEGERRGAGLASLAVAAAGCWRQCIETYTRSEGNQGSRHCRYPSAAWLAGRQSTVLT